jgi:hypothetical protein
MDLRLTITDFITGCPFVLQLPPILCATLNCVLERYVWGIQSSHRQNLTKSITLYMLREMKHIKIYEAFIIYIYIKANRAGFVCLRVCMLLGDGGLLLCSGGVFFGVLSGGNDIFDIYDCCYATGAFSLGSVLGPLLGNDAIINISKV